MDYIKMWKSKHRRDLMTEEERRAEDERIKAFKREEKRLMETLEARDRAWLRSTAMPDYGEYLPKSLNLTRKKYDNTSDDDLALLAEKRVARDREKADIMRRHASDYNGIIKDIERAENRRDDALITLKSRAQSMRQNAKTRAHMNGMLGSSTARLLDEEIANEASKAGASIARRAEDDIAKYKAKLSTLTSERDEALMKADLKRAKAISDEMARLAKRRDDTNERVTEYNNNVDEREKAYAVRRRKAIESMNENFRRRGEREAKNEYWRGYSGEKKREYEERKALVEALYNEVPKDVALKAMKSNPRLKILLGKEYNRLLSQEGARD